MHHNFSLPTAIFMWTLLTGMGILQNIKARCAADRAGKIFHKFFKRRSEILFCAVIAFWAVCISLSMAGSVWSGGRITVIGVISAILSLIMFAVWLPILFGFYVTRKGIIYADSRRESESFTVREYGDKIGIFRLGDIRSPICTVEDSAENREILAEFWRELPERKDNPYRDKILHILDNWEIIFEDFNIDFSLPLKCQTVRLGEDLLQAKLGSYTADIGWYPEFDPNGKLRTVLIEESDWERPLAEYEDIAFDDFENHLCEVARRVEDFYS